MTVNVRRLLTAVLALQLMVAIAAISALAAEKPQTLSGKVSDSMCGAKHQMPGNDAACTRTCIQHGAHYALVVGDKVYTLVTNDKATLSKLNDLAGANATVSGDVKGDTIAVQSVTGGS